MASRRSPRSAPGASSKRARPWDQPPQPLRLTERLRLFGEIFVAYLAVWRRLRCEPLDRVVEGLRGEGTVELPASGPPLGEAIRLGWIVVRSLAVLPGDTRCLRRSLVLLRLLGRRGIAARLVIATRSEPDFAAHAWVECEGVPVLSPLDGSFGRLVEL
jgi:transglutaminase superfamily protein